MLSAENSAGDASENPTHGLSMWLPGLLHNVVPAFGQQENKEIKEGS